MSEMRFGWKIAQASLGRKAPCAARASCQWYSPDREGIT